MEYMKIGKIVNTFGIKGELKVKSYTDFNEERFAKDNTVYLKQNDEYLPFIIKSYRFHKNHVLISFKDLGNINDVEKYKTYNIYCDKESIHELEDDEYYFFEIEGLDVYSDEDEYIGKVVKLEEGVVQNFLRISRENGDTVLIPYVDNFIVDVDVDNRKIIVHLIEGLL